MTIMNLKGLDKFKKMLDVDFINRQVAKTWRRKAKCLKNLTNENKKELKTLDLKLLDGLNYNNKPTQPLWNELKNSDNITKQQNEFAKFLYENYPNHSVKKMGF